MSTYTYKASKRRNVVARSLEQKQYAPKVIADKRAKQKRGYQKHKNRHHQDGDSLVDKSERAILLI